MEIVLDMAELGDKIEDIAKRNGFEIVWNADYIMLCKDDVLHLQVERGKDQYIRLLLLIMDSAFYDWQ